MKKFPFCRQSVGQADRSPPPFSEGNILLQNLEYSGSTKGAFGSQLLLTMKYFTEYFYIFTR
jgi:hypothetical protein